MSQTAQLRVALLMVALLTCAVAHATTVEFVAPYSPVPYTLSLYWPPIGGFQFDPYWGASGGRDTRNAPYIPGDEASFKSTFGSFTFNSITLSGWPYDNFDVGSGMLSLPISFSDQSGNALLSATVPVPRANDFVTFTDYVPDVYSILIGSPAFSSLGVRVGSITFDEHAVPEPGTVAMMSPFALLMLFRIACRRDATITISLPPLHRANSARVFPL